MKALPTLEGGLRIDAEDAEDWEVLRAILHDAKCGETDLADNLGKLVTEEEVADDWREFVVPDLRDEFETQIDLVAKAIKSAMDQTGGNPGSIWISPADGFLWYGALNQARLALEEAHQFGPTDHLSIDEFPPAGRWALPLSILFGDPKPVTGSCDPVILRE